MNRSIKFRFYSNYDKEMYQLSLLDVGGDENSCVYEGSNIRHETYDMKRMQRISDGHLMQFTGLYDKNGTEIYHADLCLYDRNINDKKDKEVFVVEYQDGAFFIESNTERVHLHSIPETQESIEVIGNVHQHNYLLERD